MVDPGETVPDTPSRRRAPVANLWYGILPAVILMGGFFVVPIGYTIGLSFTDADHGGLTLSNYGIFFANDRFTDALTRSVLLASSAVLARVRDRLPAGVVPDLRGASEASTPATLPAGCSILDKFHDSRVLLATRAFRQRCDRIRTRKDPSANPSRSGFSTPWRPRSSGWHCSESC